MTKTKAKRWLKAVRSLREYYREKNNKYKSFCPLCGIGNLDNCNECLWTLFEKQSCEWYAIKNNFSYMAAYKLRETRHPEWIALSIKRLNEWESKLLEITGGKK